MQIQVNSNGLVTVDGVSRQVDVSTLHQQVELVYFDTVRNKGMVQYFDTLLVSRQERDFAAERTAEEYAREHNLRPPEEAIYKTVQIPKPNDEIEHFSTLQEWIDRWEAAAPPPPVPVDPDPRLIEIDDNISSGQIGGLTREQLKALSVAEYNAWFNATFTTNAQLIGLLRRLTLLCIRRLL